MKTDPTRFPTALTGRPTRIALIAVLVLGVVPFLALNFHDGRQRLGDEGRWVHHVASTDSWEPIALALDHLERHGPNGLYEATYFHTSAQFVYSPLSLVLFRWGSLPPLFDWHDPESLNRTAWWMVVVLAAATACVFLSVPRRAPPAAPGERAEMGVRVLIAAVATFVFYPAIKAYSVGNLQSWLNTAYVVAILLWVQRLPFATGLVLGITSVVKPQMSLFLLWGLLRGETRLALGMLAAAVPLGIVSLLRFGWPIHAEYLSLMSVVSRRGEAYYASQCMNALLNRMFFIGNNLVWDGTHQSIPYNPFVHAATTVSSLALALPALFWRRARAAARDPLDFCTAMVTFTIAAPVAFEHHYGFMVPVFWLVLVAILERGGAKRRFMLILLGLAYLGASHFIWPTRRLADTPLNFIQSYLYFAALILLGLMYALRRTPTSLATVAAVPAPTRAAA